jgi:hypothetical protein
MRIPRPAAGSKTKMEVRNCISHPSRLFRRTHLGRLRAASRRSISRGKQAKTEISALLALPGRGGRWSGGGRAVVACPESGESGSLGATHRTYGDGGGTSGHRGRQKRLAISALAAFPVPAFLSLLPCSPAAATIHQASLQRSRANALSSLSRRRQQRNDGRRLGSAHPAAARTRPVQPQRPGRARDWRIPR